MPGHSYGDCYKGVIESVAYGLPEEIVLGHPDEVLYAGELGSTGQVPFRKGQVQRGKDGEEAEDQHPH